TGGERPCSQLARHGFVIAVASFVREQSTKNQMLVEEFRGQQQHSQLPALVQSILVFGPSLSNERTHSNTTAIGREVYIWSFSCVGHQRPRGIDGLPKQRF
ncbi:unnamed protein product, partial [Pylaiella littoralis]